MPGTPSNISFTTCEQKIHSGPQTEKMKKLDVLLSPAELPGLASRNLQDTVCVVFDVLRATSTFVTALYHGAKAIFPVSEISEALEFRETDPGILLAGERDGVKIRARPNGDVDFDLGNSPREFTPETIGGKVVVSTTTNGTRALRACAGAQTILAASFLNLTATAGFIRQCASTEILLICAGTGSRIADEDVIAAGALAELLSDEKLVPSPSALTAVAAWQKSKSNLAAAIARAENARRLLALPGLADDVAFCLQVDRFPIIARMSAGALVSGSR